MIRILWISESCCCQLRLYWSRSSARGASWNEEYQDPATKRRRRLKSLVEEKTLRAEYKDYKLLQRRRMSTMVVNEEFVSSLRVNGRE